MNAFPKIIEQGKQRLVDARELHCFLESKQEFSNWIKSRIEKYDFEEDRDFTIILSKSSGGRPSIEYALTIDTAKEFSMVENNQKGRDARKYFIECEKVALQTVKSLSLEEMMIHQLQQRIEDKKRVDAIETRIEQIEARTTTTPDYFTVVGYAILNNIPCNLKFAALTGKKASKICKDKGIPIDKIHDPRFGRIGLYPVSVLKTVFETPIQ
jgi:phage anti-repressor protein